ncbi:predicted transcriptional regulator [Longilinea arvoryzae]|uniref:Predicted transcriptional regulator n=1 Tax=Longilinea arvoryzae TaxID=360412 RepID=A0A0S7BHI1_9CHLR|nr:helix-turn-helix transcriptional regulator [Longilinea arvoryzae]GAP13554.1 predicted transcriptional regulator [Longilinea arvoryzae]
MDPKELGRQVLAKRKEKGWSQEQLGDMAEISRNYVSQIERGEAESISIKIINKLAIALGVSPSDLGESSTPSTVMIPPPLRELALQDNLSYEVIDKLVNIPRRGKEPKSVAEWRALYDAISQFINGDQTA